MMNYWIHLKNDLAPLLRLRFLDAIRSLKLGDLLVGGEEGGAFG